MVSHQKKSIRQRYAVAHSFSGFSDSAFDMGSRTNPATHDLTPVQINDIGLSAVCALSTCHATIDVVPCVSAAAHGTADSFAVMRQAANKIAADMGIVEVQISGYIAGRNLAAILITGYGP